MQKVILLIYGNCQAQTLTGLIVGFSQVTDMYEVRYMNSFLPFHSKDFGQEDFGRVKLLWEQVGIRQALPFREWLSPGTQIVKFSELSFLPLWPFNAPNPFNCPTSDFPNGPYPYGDTVALRIARKGVRGRDILPSYLSCGRTLMPELDRLLEIETKRFCRKGSNVDVDLGPEILKNWRFSRLFASYNHPSNMLMLRLLSSLIAASGRLEITIADELWETLYEHVVVQQKGPDCEVLQMPIHPDLQSAYGLGWYSEAVTYRHFNRGAFGLETFLSDYVDYAAGREWGSSYHAAC